MSSWALAWRWRANGPLDEDKVAALVLGDQPRDSPLDACRLPSRAKGTGDTLQVEVFQSGKPVPVLMDEDESLGRAVEMPDSVAEMHSPRSRAACTGGPWVAPAAVAASGALRWSPSLGGRVCANRSEQQPAAADSPSQSTPGSTRYQSSMPSSLISFQPGRRGAARFANEGARNGRSPPSGVSPAFSWRGSVE